MEFITLGRTNLLVSRTSFGAMSLDCKEIQAFGDLADEKACAIVHQAYDAGINFFDTSHTKVACERRLGAALHGIRQNVMIATKSAATDVEELCIDLTESLQALESDTIDLYQLENPKVLPLQDDPLYKKLLKFKETGQVKHIGLAADDFEIAKEAVECGLYETLQFPFSMISGQAVQDLVADCEKREIGFIASQPLNGGVVSNIPLAFGFFSQFENVVPVWGAHTQEELGQILYFVSHPPVIDEQFKAEVENARMFFN